MKQQIQIFAALDLEADAALSVEALSERAGAMLETALGARECDGLELLSVGVRAVREERDLYDDSRSVAFDCTAGDRESWLRAIWAALDEWRAIVAPEGKEGPDSEWGDVTTAMAWTREALGLPSERDRDRLASPERAHAIANGFAPWSLGGGLVGMAREFGPLTVICGVDEGCSEFGGDDWTITIDDEDGTLAQWEWNDPEPLSFADALAAAIKLAETLDMEQSARRRGDIK